MLRTGIAQAESIRQWALHGSADASRSLELAGLTLKLIRGHERRQNHRNEQCVCVFTG